MNTKSRIPNLTVALTIAGCVSLLACEKRDDGTTTKPAPTAEPATVTPPQAAKPEVPAAAQPALASDDEKFITKAAQDGMLEVAVGKEIVAKAASPDVKTFGDHMVQDHGKANEELKALASKKGVVPPTTLDKEHQAKLEDITKLSGKKLEDKYTADMVEDHEEDVKAFKKAAQDLKDPDLREWAAKTLPTLEHHLTMSKDVRAKTTGKKP